MATKEIRTRLATVLRPVLNHRIRIIRTIVQFIMFGLLNGLIFGIGRIVLILPIEFPSGGPFSTVWSAFEALQYSMTWWIFPYLAISVFVLFGSIFGKTTCGWACPMGLFQDLFRFIPIKKRKVSKPTNKSLSRIGIAIVIFIVIMSFIIGITLRNSGSKTAFGAGKNMPFGTIDPAATLFATLYYYLKWGSQYPTFGEEIGNWQFVFFIRLFILIIVLVLITLYPRAYCRWMCPSGAILGLFSRYSILGMRINKNRCTSGCNDCENACPVQVPILSYDKDLTDKMCTNCGECIDACNEGALKLSLRF
ncbi:MAG: 4Fe-4S binding protein [Candidatus Heimdallarchaeota archaeon]|nr:4Fe-4S binding protein [Candidatus Heimdallarchaeota archaeon]MCK4954202.1 4Fe-4S binding protein [Candidatus Heimdallarchaeota archaeon]